MFKLPKFKKGSTLKVKTTGKEIVVHSIAPFGGSHFYIATDGSGSYAESELLPVLSRPS